MHGLILLVFWWMFPSKETYFLKVNISGFPSSKGYANVALFNSSSGFPVYGKQYQGKVVSIKDGTCQVSFTGLPAGSYSVAVYHDENSNQKMDKNLLAHRPKPMDSPIMCDLYFPPPRSRSAN